MKTAKAPPVPATVNAFDWRNLPAPTSTTPVSPKARFGKRTGVGKKLQFSLNKRMPNAKPR